MVSRNIPAKAGVESVDLLTEKFRASMLALESRRTEKRRLTDQIKSVETTSLQPETLQPEALQPETRAAPNSAADESREHAARCLKLAEEANFRQLRDFFLAEADRWLRLAEQQEQREKRPLKTAILSSPLAPDGEASPA